MKLPPNSKIPRQLKQGFQHPEMVKYAAALQKWFLNDMIQHPEAYQPVIDQLCQLYPEIRDMWVYFRRGQPIPYHPRQAAFDAMINAAGAVAKPRMPDDLVALETAASAVIPNARRN